MAITANAWVSASGAATITFWSSVGWTNPAWSLQGNPNEFPSASYISLYKLWQQSGDGVINGNHLTIVIAECPEGFFLVRTEHGDKLFNLSDGMITFGAGLAGTNSANVLTEASNRYSVRKKAFIFFGGDLKPFQGRSSAQLQKDGVIHAVLGGNAVDWISDAQTAKGSWAIPAMLFTDFFWHINPSGPTEYNLVFKESKRSGTGPVRSYPVTLDKSQIYSPLGTTAFPVKSSNYFKVSLTQGLIVQ